MRESLFDDLARALSEPMPRRRVLRLAGGVLLGAVVPGMSAGRAIAAGSRRAACFACECPSSIPGLFSKECCPIGRAYTEYTCECQSHPAGDGKIAVCVPRSTCPEERRGCGPCCPEGRKCNTLLGECECPPGREKCASKCCRKGERCCPSTRMMPQSRCYDPKTQCCTPVAGVVAKKPIRAATDCPNRVPKTGHKPKANGCGPEQGALKYVLPNRPAGADFKPACDYHDICYETCRTRKAFCDRRFRKLMNEACKEEFGSGLRYRACIGASTVYYTAVSTRGDEAYDEAQRAACSSCC